MAILAPVGGPQLDEGCRILTISASLEGSSAFIARLRALSKSKHDPTTVGDVPQSGAGPVISQYAITNRYYSADVHFAAYSLDAVYPGLFSLDRGPDYKPPPAVIFVWIDGEPYAKYVEELSRVMATASYEPEVCLAVRIPREATQGEELNESEEENTDIDTALMSFGFEYVDATRESIPRANTSSEDADNDVPSLPRVLDALSTIMWPSMQSSKSGKESGPATEMSAENKARRDWERNSIMEELLSVSNISGISRVDAHRAAPEVGEPGRDADEDGDIDTLFSPYDFNSNAHFTGISSRPAAGALVASPTDIPPASPFGLDNAAFGKSDAGVQQVSLGFEDDFTVFVSAPPDAPRTWADLDLSRAAFDAETDVGAGETTPMATAFPDSVVTGDSLATRNAGLTPASAHTRGNGRLYRSLGSVSDFGGDDSERDAYQALGDAQTDEEDYGVEEWEDAVEDTRDDSWEENTGDWADEGEVGGDDDDDAGMPSKDEILATAARIFGGASGPAVFKTAAQVNREAQGASGTAQDAPDLDPDEADNLGPAGPIDIEHVLRSLQGLRTEIAGVEDEDERRRMAARVALGFVYGMDIEKGLGSTEK